MKKILALLALGTLPACTTTRVDDHSYHHNDTPPTQNITYSTTVIKHDAPRPSPSRPTYQQQDQEYIQYQQDAPSRQSSYVVPSSYNYAPTTYNNYAAPVYYVRPQPTYYRPPMQVVYSRPTIVVRARFQP